MQDIVDRRAFLRRAIGLVATGVAGSAIAGLAAACASPPPPASNATTAPAPTGAAAAKGQLIRIGFIPLTDCSSVAMASELGLFAKHGVNVELSREASWANVRDKLLSGDLEASHCLF